MSNVETALAPWSAAAPESQDTGAGTEPEFDPAAVDKPAFIRACEEAAKDWPGRLRTAKAKAAAKHMVNLAIAVVVTVVIIAVVIAIAVASRGEGIGRIAAVFAGLFRWAKNSAYRPYWALRRTAKGAVLQQALPIMAVTVVQS